MYASETIQNCKNPTGHIDTLKGNNTSSISCVSPAEKSSITSLNCSKQVHSRRSTKISNL